MATSSWMEYGGTTLENGRFDLEGLLSIAEEAVAKNVAGSLVLDDAKEMRIPKFDHTELSLGRFLGKGGFAVVTDVSKIKLNANSRDIEDNDDEEGAKYLPHAFQLDQQVLSPDRKFSVDIVQDKDFMAANYRRGGKKTCRYALKRVQNFKSAHNFVSGVVDLYVEAKFLAVLRHPNIIKMRGTASTSPFDVNSPFFLLLDRLNEILTNRLVKWKARKNSIRTKLLTCTGHVDISFWNERTRVALGIAKALKYMHSKNVVYRDVKPDNIGFDVRGDVKLFDFGLAKELIPSKHAPDGLYNLTGDTGSPRFMAPEVALSKPYNELADVYSFSVLLWEMLEVETPFREFYTMKKFQARVVQGGARPSCDPSWPIAIQALIQSGWSSVIRDRPSMGSVVACLHSEAIESELKVSDDYDSTLTEPMDECSSMKSTLSYRRLLKRRGK